MLNIISRSVVSKRVSGPRKVVDNLIKGLDKINYPYVVNASLDACKRIWIHDDTDALREVVKIKGVFPIVGPNLYVTPRQIPIDINLSKTLYLHPSMWVIDMWKEAGFSRAPLAAWATGIDTTEFKVQSNTKTEVLVYFKERPLEELTYVETLLDSKKIQYSVIRYGHYNESEYQTKLAVTKYIIWIGRQESQGIALQEAMAMNVPILVWDVLRLGHWDSTAAAMDVFNDQENNFTGATSAFYFDERCGLITREKEHLKNRISKMEQCWSTFTPRSYILENLSLAKKAKDFIMFYETHFNLSYADGLIEMIRNKNKWKNAKMPFILSQQTKDILKKYLK